MSALVPFPINPPPGVVVTDSERVIEGRWTIPFDKARFVNGKPQKLGGNITATSTAMPDIPRTLFSYHVAFSRNYVLGTATKVYYYPAFGVIANDYNVTFGWGTQADITPVGFAGSPDIVPGGGATTPTSPWSFDNFGSILLGCPASGGRVYYYDYSNTPLTPLTAIASSNINTQALCVTAERFVFAAGIDMHLRACSQGDYTDWTPTSSNTAFDRVLTGLGEALVGAKVLAPYVVLVWSTADLFRFQYNGGPFLYESTLVATGCGLPNQNAAVIVSGVAYWMGIDNFYVYDGGTVSPMPNVDDIRAYVFDNIYRRISSAARYVVHTSYVPNRREIRFTYSDTTDLFTPTHYVLFSLESRTWAVGTQRRSASHTSSDGSHWMADIDGSVYLHEAGHDDHGSAMSSTVTLAPYALSEGTNNIDVESVLVDLKDQAGDVTLTINTYDRLNDAAAMDSETETMTTTTGLIDTRVSGRYVSLAVNSNVVGGYWRFGKPVAFIRPAGTRS